MSAREDILQRIRTATADVTEPDPALDVPVEWTYGQPLATADVLADFVEKVEDYKARVVRVAEDGIGGAIVDALAGLDAASAVLPEGLPDAWGRSVVASLLVTALHKHTTAGLRRPVVIPVSGVQRPGPLY